MTGEEVRAVLSFEESLKPGDAVEVRWTNSFRVYACRGEVVRVNAASVRVSLTEPPKGYEAGRKFSVPRFASGAYGSGRWSVNNRVAPLPAA